jgi:hypothetical protein
VPEVREDEGDDVAVSREREALRRRVDVVGVNAESVARLEALEDFGESSEETDVGGWTDALWVDRARDEVVEKDDDLTSP